MTYILSSDFSNIANSDAIYFLIAFVIAVVLFFAMMVYYKIRVARLEQYAEYLKEQNNTIPEVSSIARKIEDNLQQPIVKATNFEDEQEEKAIISYQELLKKEKPIEPSYNDQNVYKNEFVEQMRKIPDTEEQMKRVSEEIRRETIEERPVVRENKEFLNSLVSLRRNLK